MRRGNFLASVSSFVCVLCVVAAATPAARAQGQPRRAMAFSDLAAMHRLSEAQISSDGKMVVYTVATPDLEANRLERNLWLVPVEGGEPRQLTRSGRDMRPQWSPDSKRIAFLSGLPTGVRGS